MQIKNKTNKLLMYISKYTSLNHVNMINVTAKSKYLSYTKLIIIFKTLFSKDIFKF